jgi:hypothetical protein
MNPIEARMYLDGRQRQQPTLQGLAEEQDFEASLKQRIAAQRNLELDHGYRRRTPGYREYADEALHDLFPTGADMLSTTGIPLVADAADAALAANSLTKGEYRNAFGYGLGAALPFVAGSGIIRTLDEVADAPEKTARGYKLFRTLKSRPGELLPLYVKNKDEVPMGDWVRAEAGELTDRGKVKSALGPLAYRPGWHGGDAPASFHIGVNKGPGNKPLNRGERQVWAEVDFADDVDWQSKAIAQAIRKKNSDDIIASTAHITDQVPYMGYYRYKTNPNMAGEWMIGGDMRVNRVLSDEEVADINAMLGGPQDLPRTKPLDLREYGF